MSGCGLLRNAFATCVVATAIAGAVSAQESAASRQFTYACDSLAIDLKNNRSVCSNVAVSDGSIQITANEGTTNQTNFDSSEWHFAGDVRMSMDSASLTADLAVFRFEANELVSGMLTGDPVEVRDYIEQQDATFVGTAERVSYDNVTGTARLAGETTLALGANEYRLCDLVYDLTEKTFTSGSSDCGVVIRIAPPEENDPAPDESSTGP